MPNASSKNYEQVDINCLNEKAKNSSNLNQFHCDVAPMWAIPPQQIHTWHLDIERMILVHPLIKKHIEVRRVDNKKKLVAISNFILKQKNAEDKLSLMILLDRLFLLSFAKTLPEMLAYGPTKFVWPGNEVGNDDTEDESGEAGRHSNKSAIGWAENLYSQEDFPEDTCVKIKKRSNIGVNWF